MTTIILEPSINISAWVRVAHGDEVAETLDPFIERLHDFPGTFVHGCMVDAQEFAAHYVDAARRFACGQEWMLALLLRRAEDVFRKAFLPEEIALLQQLLAREAAKLPLILQGFSVRQAFEFYQALEGIAA